jgi:hypothetical protein
MALSARHRDREKSVVPIRRRTSERWLSTCTAVVGSLMAGDSAMSAMSTMILMANAGSCSIVRSSLSTIILRNLRCAQLLGAAPP